MNLLRAALLPAATAIAVGLSTPSFAQAPENAAVRVAPLRT